MHETACFVSSEQSVWVFHHSPHHHLHTLCLCSFGSGRPVCRQHWAWTHTLDHWARNPRLLSHLSFSQIHSLPSALYLRQMEYFRCRCYSRLHRLRYSWNQPIQLWRHFSLPSQRHLQTPSNLLSPQENELTPNPLNQTTLEKQRFWIFQNSCWENSQDPDSVDRSSHWSESEGRSHVLSRTNQ